MTIAQHTENNIKDSNLSAENIISISCIFLPGKNVLSSFSRIPKSTVDYLPVCRQCVFLA